MPNDVVFATDRSTPENVGCKRRDVLNRIQGLLTAMENPPYDLPTPKATVKSAMCDCGPGFKPGKATYYETQYLDGGEAIPFKMVDDSTKVKWTPTYPKTAQNAHPGMICYCVPPILDKELCNCPKTCKASKTNPAAAAAAEAAAEAARTSSMCCECPEAEGSHGHRPPKGCKPMVDITIKDYCTSGQEKIYCPIDPKHKHWSPYKGSCVHPRPCYAQCFDHSTSRDFINVVPNYKYYLEPRDGNNYC